MNDDEVYSSIVYSCSPENVESVMIDGRWVYRHREHTTLDETRAVKEAQVTLKQLLHRVVMS
jgi:cytosine/adenosine deaminase-related metal-dependent hydrolase